MPPTVLARRAVLLAALLCLLHALCGSAAAGSSAWHAQGQARGHAHSDARGAVGVTGAVADDPVPAPGPHPHPASPARRAGSHAGPQQRTLSFTGRSCSDTGLPHPLAGAPHGPHRADARPPAGPALAHTVLRC